MTTKTHTIDLTSVEPEFDRPCDNCSKKAEWIVRSAHTRNHGCPGELFQCDQHKRRGEKHWVWALTLQQHRVRCKHCGNVITGNLSDNLRFIKL